MRTHFDAIRLAEKAFRLLENKTFYFYGVNNQKFKLDDLVFQALEDPNDGYRSSLGAIIVTKDDGIFNKRPLCKVTLQYIDDGYRTVHRFIDIDTNHIWLEVGTKNYDDYYPCYVFAYTPDTTQTNYVEIEDDYKVFTERYPELMLKAHEWFNRDLEISFKGY